MKTIIFDADGMVIKRESYFSKKLSAQYNIPDKKIQLFFEHEWPEIVVGKSDLIQKIEPYLHDWNWPGSAQKLLDYWFKSEHRIDQQISTAIKKLRSNKYRCILATNQEKYRLAYMTNQMGFGKLFNTIYTSCNIGFKKPQPEFFKYILTKEPIEPDNLLFWDDEKQNVIAARKLAISARSYTTFNHFRRETNDFLNKNVI